MLARPTRSSRWSGAPLLTVPTLRVQPQVEVPGVGRADIGDLGLKIAVECESWAYHSGDEPFRRDIRRYTSMTASGWLVARFVWEDAMQRPVLIRDTLARLVRLRHSDTQFTEILRNRGVAI